MSATFPPSPQRVLEIAARTWPDGDPQAAGSPALAGGRIRREQLLRERLLLLQQLRGEGKIRLRDLFGRRQVRRERRSRQRGRRRPRRERADGFQELLLTFGQRAEILVTGFGCELGVVGHHCAPSNKNE